MSELDLFIEPARSAQHSIERYPVPCPREYCAAPAGEPCHSAWGNLVPTHTPRRRAAEAIGASCGSPTADELAAADRQRQRGRHG